MKWMDIRKIIIPWISLSCILIGMLLGFDSVFECNIQIKQHILPVILIAGIVLFLVLCLSRKHAVIVMLFLAGGLGIFAWTQIARLEEDFLSIVYYINQKAMAYGDVALLPFEGVKGDMNDNLLIGMLGVFLSVFIALFAFRLRNRWYGMLPVYAVFCIDMLVGKTPGKKAVCILVAGLALAFAWLSDQKHGGRRLFEVDKLKRKRSALRYILLSGMLAVGIAGAWYFGQQTEGRLLKDAAVYLSRQHKMERQAKHAAEQMIQYVRAQFGLDSDGYLSNSEPRYKDEAVLEITIPVKPETALYLRGFTGGDYQNGRWKECDTEAFRQIAPTQQEEMIFHNLNYNFFRNYLASNYSSNDWYDIGASGDNSRKVFKIAHVGSGKNSKYAYIPYVADIDRIFNDNTDDCIEMNGDNGIRKKENEFYVECYLVRPESLRIAVMDTEEEYGSRYWLTEGYDDLDSGQIGRYTDYIEETYCRLPEKGMDRLQGLINRYEYGYDDADAFELAETVRNILGQRAVYDKDLEPVPAGQDYVEYFLFTQKRGYCEHFATAGTLLLRACGVPARYVSGYKVTPDRFEQNEDGSYTARVLDSDAHAWSEFFNGWCGWVPAEMTPGESNTSRTQEVKAKVQPTPAPENLGKMQTAEEADPTKEPKETMTPEPVSEEPKAKTEGETDRNVQRQDEKDRPVPMMAVIAAVLILAAVGGFFARRCYLKDRDRKALLHAKGDRNAQIRIRAQMFFAFLIRNGMRRLRRKSEAEWFAYLERTYAQVDETVWRKLKEIIQEAEFSDQSVSAEKYEFFIHTIPEIEQMILEQKKLRNRTKK